MAKNAVGLTLEASGERLAFSVRSDDADGQAGGPEKSTHDA
jgi:hypothetical protein